MTMGSIAVARPNRIIAIVAGAITVAAIVLGFAGDYLGLPFKGIRPAAELLLLAEMVVLVVLERHQLFEPVHETVAGMHGLVREIHAMVAEGARSSGQVTACANALEIYRTVARILREALARDHQTPQILRIGRLVGRIRAMEDPDLGTEFHDMVNALAAFNVIPGSSPESRARPWSVRSIVVFSTLVNFETALGQLVATLSAGKPSNLEFKALVRAKAEATLSPTVITDHDVLMTFDDSTASDRWGVWFRGPQYRAFFERWFDDLWASIPETHLLYSRNGPNENAINRIRKELEALEGAQIRQTA